MIERQVLYDDLKERNHTARSARIKPSGKKKRMLPSDGLSAGELKKRNGEIIVYEMKKPITFQRFKSYPKDMQKEYLQWFVDEFGASRGMIAQLFGVTGNAVYQYFKQQGYLDMLVRQMRFSDKERFAVWFKQFSADAEKQAVEEPKPPVEKKEKVVVPPFFNTITSGEILLEGKASEIGQTLFNMFQNETVTMQVKFEVVKRKEKVEELTEG